MANDPNNNSPFRHLSYASRILKDFKFYLRNLLPEEEDLEACIEKALKQLFIRQMHTFPYITVESLKEAMVYKAGMKFDDKVTYNKFFTEI